LEFGPAAAHLSVSDKDFMLNKRQVHILILAALISLISVMIKPKIFDLSTGLEARKESETVEDRYVKIHYIIIPGIAFGIGGYLAFLFRNKKKDNNH